jgi:nucleotide-binding universal stress UspA family protein
MSSASSDAPTGSATVPTLRRILVGVDGHSEGRDAAALAAALERASGADTMLLAVLSDPVVLPLTGMSWNELHKQAEATLAETRDTIVPDARVLIETDFSVGRALERVAAREHVDLVVLGSSPRAPAGEVRIGNRTRQLIGDARCALAVAPRGLAEAGTPSIERIGVGYDGGPESVQALALAGVIARACGAELGVRAVVDDRIPTFGLRGSRGSRIIAEWKSLIAEDVEALRKRAVEAAKSAGVDARVEVISGHPADALLELSEEVDLLVVGSRRWGAVARLLLGSTGEALVHGAVCPILIVPRTDRTP